MPPCPVPSDLIETTRSLLCPHQEWQREAASGGSVLSCTQSGSIGLDTQGTAGTTGIPYTGLRQGLQVPHYNSNGWDQGQLGS